MEETPPGGFRLTWAITAFAVGDDAVLVPGYEELWARAGAAMVASARQHFWFKLVNRALAGDVVARGFKAGADVAASIDASLLRASKPIFDVDQLDIAGTVYHGVTFFPASDALGKQSVEADAQHTPVSLAKSGRLDFRDSDAVLVRVMVKLIALDLARGPEDAAKMLASVADGFGKESSKGTRLLKRFAEPKS